ncbi:hypothetical protein L950_0211675 [Sphingobacterium sp. IITKGP-BTPF85]|nr:hypothetical protein L950_0211675 [Sphingobacterium sp. IITKGP-BTPF85]
MQPKGTPSSSSSTAMSTGPSASDWKGAVKGTWVLNTIDRENLPASYTIKSVFEEAPAECFIGSTWTLPGNGKGNISFSADGKLCALVLPEILYGLYSIQERITDNLSFSLKRFMLAIKLKMLLQATV